MEDTRDLQDMPNNFGEMDKQYIKNAMKDLTEEQLNEQLFGKDVLDIAEALKYAVADDKNIDKALEKIETVVAKETAADKYYNIHKTQLNDIAEMALEHHKVPLVIVVYVSKGVGEFKIRYISDLTEQEKIHLQSSSDMPIEEQYNFVIKHEYGSRSFFHKKI